MKGNQRSLKVIRASIVEEDVVVGFNSERADMDNPSGALYGKVSKVMAETLSGRRFLHIWSLTADVAQRLADKVSRSGEIDPQFWSETFPVYGSMAWEDEEESRRFALAFSIKEGQDPSQFA
jgi:hypothetical protein